MTSKGFVQTQAQQFNRYQPSQNFSSHTTTPTLRSRTTSPQTTNDQFNTLSSLSSTPISSSSLLLTRPFYRQTTFSPPPNFGRSIKTNHNPQRRYSANNQHQNAICDQDEIEQCYSLTKNELDSNEDDESSDESSDESNLIEFPPPPREFLTPNYDDHIKNDKKEPYNFTTKQSCSPTRMTPTNSFVHTVVYRSDSSSSLSNSYHSDLESSSSPVAMNLQHATDRKTPTSRAMISVSSSQTPLITIAAGSPTRSEIRVAASPKLPKATTVREIRISRPDSPSITLNRNQIGNGTPGINSGTGGAFHISVGAPNHKHYQQQSENFSSSSPINVRGRTSPAFRLIDVPVQRENNDIRDNQYMSNLISNRFKPLFAYSNNNTNNINPSTLDRRSPAPSQRPISRGATPPFSLSTLPPHSSPVPSPSSVSSPSQPLSSTLMRNVRGGSTEKEADIDHLTRMLMKSMNTSNEPNFFGMCARCNDEIIGQENGLVAMDRMYHVACFTCSMCACRLRGMHFYAMENKPYCEPCYINSLEKCIACSRPITDRILRATGKPYHPHCFRCVACTRSLDGIPFTIDATMQIHCIDCFHRKFAPRCYACNKPILPTPGQEETIRIVALDRSYHVDCYRCESCQIQFATDEGCYPLNDHILCIKCNRNHHHNNQKSKITAIIDNHYHHHLQNNIDDL